jgi:hypothetical protein
MGFLLLPLAVLLFWMGQTGLAWHQSEAIDGAGRVGRMESLAQVSAQQAELFGSACASTAIAHPGVVAASLPVTLPPGVVLPPGALCMTTAGTGSGRNVYGYLPVSPGAVGKVLADTQDNAVWYRVQRAGVAIGLATGEAAAVPVAIPVGYLVDWIETPT